MITEDARALLATGTVCDSCLGRPFAERSFGLTNAERGRALRTTVALADDEDFDPTDPADCWVCEGYCGTFDAIADAIVDALEGCEFATYQVGSRIPPLSRRERTAAPGGRGPRARRRRIDEARDQSGGRPARRREDRDRGRLRPARRARHRRPRGVRPARDPRVGGAVTSHAVDVQINPAFVYGRYRKLERDIPQTGGRAGSVAAAGSSSATTARSPVTTVAVRATCTTRASNRSSDPTSSTRWTATRAPSTARAEKTSTPACSRAADRSSSR